MNFFASKEEIELLFDARAFSVATGLYGTVPATKGEFVQKKRNKFEQNAMQLGSSIKRLGVQALGSSDEISNLPMESQLLSLRPL